MDRNVVEDRLISWIDSVEVETTSVGTIKIRDIVKNDESMINITNKGNNESANLTTIVYVDVIKRDLDSYKTKMDHIKNYWIFNLVYLFENEIKVDLLEIEAVNRIDADTYYFIAENYNHLFYFVGLILVVVKENLNLLLFIGVLVVIYILV